MVTARHQGMCIIYVSSLLFLLQGLSIYFIVQTADLIRWPSGRETMTSATYS